MKDLPQGTTQTIYVTKIVRGTGFAVSGKFTEDGKDYKPKTMEDLCSGHKWRHTKKLPKNWVYCYKCKTEKLETL